MNGGELQAMTRDTMTMTIFDILSSEHYDQISKNMYNYR